MEASSSKTGRSQTAFPAWLIWLGVAFGLLITGGLSYLTFATAALTSIEQWTGDWRTALLADRAMSQNGRLAVVLVDDDALFGLPYRSPIDRGFLASLLTKIDQAGVAVIGLDIVVDQATEPSKDEQLVAALHGARSKVVLGALDLRTPLRPEQRGYHTAFLNAVGGAHGFVNLRYEIDRVVRAEASPVDPTGGEHSFAAQVAAAAGATITGPAGRIAWLREPRDGTDTFLELRAGDLVGDASPARAKLADRLMRQLQGRIVLIGGDLSDQTDRHATPLSKIGWGQMPGVLIHAQLVAQYLDGRRYYPLPDIATMAMMFVMSVTAFLLGWRLPWLGVLTGSAPTLMLAVIDALMFSMWRLTMPVTLFILAWLCGVFCGRAVAWTLSRNRVR